MISLEEYLNRLKEYEFNINQELKMLFSKAKINFTYEDINITSFKNYDNENCCVKLIIKKYNNHKDHIMEINCRDLRIETLTYQNEKFSTALIIEKAKIDKNTLKEIIGLCRTHQEFFHNELSYENIMRSIRKLPNHLPFFDHLLTEKENYILKETMLDIDRLPSFLKENIKSK